MVVDAFSPRTREEEAADFKTGQGSMVKPVLKTNKKMLVQSLALCPRAELRFASSGGFVSAFSYLFCFVF